MSMRRLSVTLLVILVAGTVLAADESTRDFAAAQQGHVNRAPSVLPWAPDRVLIRFTPEALTVANVDDPVAKAAGALPRTGLVSLDAALDAATAIAITAAFPDPADKALATRLGVNRWYRLDLASGADVPEVARQLALDPALEYALPDLRAFPAVVPNDSLHANHWGHNNTAQLPDLDWGGTYGHTLPTTVGTVGFDANAESAWDGTQGYGDASVVIAILDSGVDSTHPDLNQVTGYDFGDDDIDPHDDSADPGHGTACAGVAAAVANNSLGVAGIAGGSSIMPLKVSDSGGSLFFSYIVNAMYYAADNGADVISMSFGADATAYAPMDDAVDYADALGVVMLAATGNENTSTIGYPAYNPLVIGVGAASPCGERKRSSSDSGEVNPGVSTDPNGYTCDGERWWGSNWGPAVQDDQGAVDIIAPTILPTTDIQGSAGYDPGDYSGFFNGTSCATPYAAGVCALILSVNPSLSPAAVRAQLTGTAQDIVSVESVAGWDRYTGYGMVDAAAAVGISAPEAPVADFTATPISGCAPLDVAFSDLSTGTIDSWIWDFGDGGNGEVPSLNHVYTVPGTYDVSLTVTGPGGEDTLTLVGFVTVDGPPAAGFTADPTTITAGETVTFADASTGAPTSWDWDFGDGESGTDQNPVHAYALPGSYTVRLIVTNPCGPDTVQVADMITVNAPPAPTAGFSALVTSGCAPLTVDFTDQSAGLIDTWAWEFGDGGVSSEQNPGYEYTAPGDYDVTLTVSNLGGSDSLTMTGFVTAGGPPAASFTASATVVTAGDPVTFTDTSTGAPDTWDWDFGDGGGGVDQNPVHVFTLPGVYSVRLIAANACGPDTTLVADMITVNAPPAPVAGFLADPTAGCAPLTVGFTDQSAGDIDTWAWDFGDGGTATEASPGHEYTLPGNYDVQLIVSGLGGADTLTVADAVVVEVPVSAAFSVSDTLGAPPLAVAFTDLSSGTPTSWFWDFGDAGTDTVPDPVHTYTANGIYDVTLVVANGCSADTLVMIAAVQASDLSATGGTVPASFGLAGIYPNPFNPMTTIAFGMKSEGRARLEIFDVSGRRIATLVDEHRGAGEHSVTWQPRGLASGVYFARLSANGQVQTQRLTLLK